MGENPIVLCLVVSFFIFLLSCLEYYLKTNGKGLAEFTSEYHPNLREYDWKTLQRLNRKTIGWFAAFVKFALYAIIYCSLYAYVNVVFPDMALGVNIISFAVFCVLYSADVLMAPGSLGKLRPFKRLKGKQILAVRKFVPVAVLAGYSLLLCLALP